MKLVSFQVKNYRSVNDSGPISASKVTTLVGRNESGKTNLLSALHSINPPGGAKDLSPIKDFPRHRRLSECKDDTPVVETLWDLDPNEQAKLASMFPRAKGVTRVEIGRRYKASPFWVGFKKLKAPDFETTTIAKHVDKLKSWAATASENLEAAAQSQLRTAAIKFGAALSPGTDPLDWSAKTIPALTALRQAVASAGVKLAEEQEEALAALKTFAEAISADDGAHSAARNWAASLLPVFVYVDEYPELDGHQNIADYLQRKAANQRKAADLNFEKLCKVADLDPQQLHSLLANNDHETRNQLANRAGAVVTGEIRRLWRDRALKVRFNPDAQHLDTFVSDPNSVYDVEVNFDERSRGFKWFFSFYITFAADTRGGPAESAILLLDEPGLYLHATSQSDLLRHLAVDFKNQVLFTTHSPFMVPTDNLDSIRTVNIDQDSGTTVTNDPSGDPRTLFPIQAALGYNLAQTLFVGPSNLVVEGVTDYWIMSSVSEHLRSVGKTALPEDLTLTPAGGAQKVTYMVALLTSERLHVMVLFDDERQARTAKEDLVKQKLIREDNVVFVTDGFDGGKPSEADIEDLLDSSTYDALVQESYQHELKGMKLALNANIPRVVKRYEDAFKAVGLEFHKTRPARLLLSKMATNAEEVMTPGTTERFERLYGKILAQLKRHLATGRGPFH